MRFYLVLLISCTSVYCSAQQTGPVLDPGLGVDVVLEAESPRYCDQVFEEPELSRFKKQALQSVSLSGGYMGDLGGDGLSSSYADLSISSGIPLGSFENILGVRPRLRVDWIDAAPEIDVPSELYEFELSFFHRCTIRDGLTTTAIVSPSLRSDLTTSDDAFRIFALGLLTWEWIPDRLKLSGGAVYLARADFSVLPAIGLSWTPSQRTKLDLQFPASKLSRRLAKDGGRSETWAYLSAGLGGNTWSVTRSTMVSDELSLRELNLRVGIERIVDGGGGCFADVGFAFDRQLEYSNDDSVVKLNDAILVRGGWRY